MAKKKPTLTLEAARLLDECLTACQDHGRSVGVDTVVPERADTYIRRQLRSLAVESQNKAVSALREHMLAREAEVQALVNHRNLLDEALRNMLIAVGVLHKDARPNGSELLVAAEDYLAYKART